jgi:hypothetical protein
MGCLYVLLGFDLLAWGGFTALGLSGFASDRYWGRFAPFYVWLPAKVTLAVLLAVAVLAWGPRFDRLRPISAPAAFAVGVASLIGLAVYLFFYTGGI